MTYKYRFGPMFVNYKTPKKKFTVIVVIFELFFNFSDVHETISTNECM